jgi:hypothetical protein
MEQQKGWRKKKETEELGLKIEDKMVIFSRSQEVTQGFFGVGRCKATLAQEHNYGAMGQDHGTQKWMVI